MNNEKGSFFKTFVKRKIYNFWISLYVFTGILILGGIIGTIVGALMNSSLIPLFLSMPLTIIITYPIILTQIPLISYYKKIEVMLDEKDEESLLAITEKVSNHSIVALCALYDLNRDAIRPILNRFLEICSNPKNDMGLLRELTLRMHDYERSTQYLASQSKLEISIPISKVYFVKSEDELGFGMISKLQLNFDSEIVICPYCSNMARKDLLSAWLENNDYCPTCKSSLSLDDCPLVDIKDS